MKSEKILFIARNYPPNIGGLETLNRELYLQLKKKVSIELVKNTGHRYSIKFLVSGLFKVIFSNYRVILLSDALLSLYVPFIKVSGKKVLIRVNGLDITGPNFFYQLIIPFLTNLSDRVICISNSTKKECIQRKINPQKIVVIPPGIDNHKYYDQKINKDVATALIFKRMHHNIKNKKIILTIGRLIERKGQLWFIKNVFPNLSQNVVYFIVGEGHDYLQIKKYISQKKYEKRIFLLGSVNEEIKRILLNISDIFIMCNIKIKGDVEGFGLVAIEASSCGLPVIASNLEGLKDAIINGKNGFLVKPYDVNEFLRVINKSITNDEKRKNFGEKIRTFTLENYSWKKISDSYLKEFISLFNYENKKE